jgi:Ca2+ transporting ATPase
MLDAMGDSILQVLLVAAVVSLVLGCLDNPRDGWMEGSAILFAVAIVVMVTSINDYLKDKQFAKLNAQAEDHRVSVIRAGKEQEISVRDLVVGDLVQINTGDIVPADGILVRGYGINVDESSITGESDQIIKEAARAGDVEFHPFLVSGSKVMEGHGTMLVCAVGSNSAMGKNSSMLQSTEDEQTPLQEKLEVTAGDLGKIGLAVAVLTFLSLIAYDIIDSTHRKHWDHHSWAEVLSSFIFAITIIVMAVPEGLPLAVTLSLAYSVGRMKDEQNFVKHLHACETMGSATYICSDKTGTLTENKMRVTRAYLFSQSVEPSNSRLSQPEIELISEVVARNSTAYIDDAQEHVGNRTECALLSMVSQLGNDYRHFRDTEKELLQMPFNYRTKRMLTAYQDSSTTVKVYSKGAGEVLVDMCKYVLRPNGKLELLTTQERAYLKQEVLDSYAADLLRTVALAYKVTSAATFNSDTQDSASYQELERDLVLIGIVGIEDPVRKEVPDAVLKVQRAGLTVQVVTGDSLETAVRIAKHCNILREDWRPNFDNSVMLGKDFREQVGGLTVETDEEGKITAHHVGNIEAFRLIGPQLRVLARSTPEDKFLLVTGLKQLGFVVAVTGDGSNDAPALRKSDVGFAMNIAGTPLAKEAADIILLDDNFQSIVSAIKWGRNIYQCIRKFLQFQMTVNLVALFVSFAGTVIVRASPITAVQMLWVNLIMDSFAALALATEPPEEKLLLTKPFGREENIITPEMWKNIIGQGAYQITILMVVLFLGHRIFGVESGWGGGASHFTLFFNVFVFLQLFNEINCRKLKDSELNIFRGFFNNWLFLFILALTVVIQVTLVQFGGQVIGCTPLTLQQHLWCVAIGSGSLVVGLLLKLLPTFFSWIFGRRLPNMEDSVETQSLIKHL